MGEGLKKPPNFLKISITGGGGIAEDQGDVDARGFTGSFVDGFLRQTHREPLMPNQTRENMAAVPIPRRHRQHADPDVGVAGRGVAAVGAWPEVDGAARRERAAILEPLDEQVGRVEVAHQAGEGGPGVVAELIRRGWDQVKGGRGRVRGWEGTKKWKWGGFGGLGTKGGEWGDLDGKLWGIEGGEKWDLDGKYGG